MAKRGLGRGIDALIQTNQQADPRANSQPDNQEVLPGAQVRVVSREKLYGNPDQPRKDFEQAQLDELADSIREKGILQPILVEEDSRGLFMIIAGERRYRAAGLAGLTEVPVIIRKFTHEERLEIALIENIQREDLSPLEEAQAYKQLMDTFGLSQEEVAKKVGKSRSVIANALRMLRLPVEIQQAISQGELSSGHARAVLAVSLGEDAQMQMFKSIVQFDLTVREAEALSKLINSGIDSKRAIPEIRKSSSVDDEELSITSEKDILDLAAGARVKKSENPAQLPKRSPELWDMEEKLIKTLGTKVNIKGSNTSGKIEITYFSMDDLERLYDLMTKGEE